MVATVQIVEKNTTAATATDKTSGTVRFKNADDATVNSQNRLIIPTSNTEYSFEKYLRLKVTVAPDVDIDNIQAYTDGANGFGTGVKVWYGVAAGSSGYVAPAVPTETNDPPKFQGSTVNMTDLFTATSTASIDMDGLTTGPFTGTGEIADHLVLVMEVESSASQGSLTGETLTWSYDET